MSLSKGLFSYNLFVHATAGSAASCVALLAAFPFITIIQRKQRKDFVPSAKADKSDNVR